MAWTPCYSTPLEFQAYLVKGFLEQFGVPCLLDTARFGLRPLSVGTLGEVRVLVREDFLQVAQGLIRGREGAPRPRRRRVWRGEE
jgi:hypothetical protein